MKIKFTALFILLIVLTLTAKEKNFIVVAKDGSGDFKTLTEAVDALPMFVYKRTVIFIRNGVYEERIRIEQDNVTLLGENREKTIIQYNLPRTEWNEHKDHIGPGVVNIEGDDIILENLTVKNTQPEIGPHAFAVYGMGTRTIITNCNLISKGADTVSLWDYKTGMYYHSNCYFEGAVDFVCPRGWCYIKDSQFYEVKPTAAVWHAGGYKKDQKFVIVNSSFDGVKGFKLARHHYEAQFYFIDCKFSKNLADQPIYRVTYEDTTRNRPFNWGKRYYFYDCKREGGNFSWMKNNLSTAEDSLTADEITPQWTFDGKWDPEKLLPVHLPIANNIKITKNDNNFIVVWEKGKDAAAQIFNYGSDSNFKSLKLDDENKFTIKNYTKKNLKIRIDSVTKNDTLKGIEYQFDLSKL